MSDRTARRRAARYGLAIAATLLVSACSGSDGDAPATPPTTVSTPGPSVSSSATLSATPISTPSAATPSPGPSATGTPRQALAGRDFTVTGAYSQTPVRMRLDIIELKRRGDLLDLTANLTNLEKDRSRDLRWQVASRFRGPYREDIAGAVDNFSGAVLTDVAGRKRYLVAADSGNACVCTVELNSTFVGAGQTVELSATYAAPPPSTTKLDVTVASLGTFRDLPVS